MADASSGSSVLLAELLSISHIAMAGGYELLSLSEKDYKDLASMCVQYSRDMVRKAVISVYKKRA